MASNQPRMKRLELPNSISSGPFRPTPNTARGAQLSSSSMAYPQTVSGTRVPFAEIHTSFTVSHRSCPPLLDRFSIQWLSLTSLYILLKFSTLFHVQRLRLITVRAEIRRWCYPEYFIARLEARICRRGILRKCEINSSSRSPRSSMTTEFCALTETSRYAGVCV